MYLGTQGLVDFPSHQLEQTHIKRHFGSLCRTWTSDLSGSLGFWVIWIPKYEVRASGEWTLRLSRSVPKSSQNIFTDSAKLSWNVDMTDLCRRHCWS